MKKTLALIGGGFGIRALLPAARLAGAEVKYLALTDEKRAETVATENKIPHATGNWRTLPEDKDLDGFIIACPPQVQYEIGKVLLPKGLPLFLEKPLAYTLAQAKELRTLAEKHKVATAIDFELPECESFLFAKKRIDSGELGTIQSVRYQWKVLTYANEHKLQTWKSRRDQGGGAILQFGPHGLYHLYHFLGPLKKFWDYESKSHSAFAFKAESEGGAKITFEIDTDYRGPFTHEIIFEGSKGTGALVNRGKDYVRDFEWQESGKRQKFQPEPGDARIPAIAQMMKRWLDAIDSGRRVVPAVEEGYIIQDYLHRLQMGES